MPKLIVQSPEQAAYELPLAREVVTFGRSGACDLVLTGAGVSRQHGRFFQDASGKWWIEDLGSKNGILLAGRLIARERLSHGDELAVGNLKLTFYEQASVIEPVTEPLVTISETWAGGASTFTHTPGQMRSMDTQRLTALYDISRRLMDQRDVQGLINVATHALSGALNFGVVVFGLTCHPESEPDRLVVHPPQRARDKVTLSRSVLHRCLDTRQAILIRDTSMDTGLGEAQSIIVGGIRSALCVPLLRQNAVNGFLYVDNRRDGKVYDESDLEFAAAVGTMVGTAVENRRLQEAELLKQRMEAELASARRVQQAILPSQWPQLPGWEIHGRQDTCFQVGGDYYDALITPDGKLWLAIADVCGKGVPAALQASSIHTAIHAFVHQDASPGEVLGKINALLLRREVTESFVTCLMMRIDPCTGLATYASAGHPAAIAFGGQRPAETLGEAHGFMLGVFPEADYKEAVWQFPDDPTALLMYTDGASEATNDREDQFGEEKLRAVLNTCRQTPLVEASQRICIAIEQFRGDMEPTDDLTLLLCRRQS